ncbi:MAG: class I SAM-dependent methyltransferase [Lysobacteraceae bacterium]|nr:MAG: class I SAM-dependent methyltransferase [Xanthomonadaceae bacterium]
MINKAKQLQLSAAALVGGAVDVLSGRGWRYCACCRRRVLAFLPWRGGSAAAPPLMQALDMIGSDLDHFACPLCGSTDRERHLRLYLEETGMAATFAGKRVLHFAPERRLTPWIASLLPSEHLLADLYPEDVAVRRLDLEQMPFPDGYFDVVIANHVLEHVAHLDLAVMQIARVLKVDGWAILQVPWARTLATTIEDPSVTSSAARRELYGQEDHVRLFGADVFERIGRFGLSAEPVSHSEALASISPVSAGVNVQEPFMRFRRRQQS